MLLDPSNGQCTLVFVDKLKDMEPAKTKTEAKEACRLTRQNNITRFDTNMTLHRFIYCDIR